jgi:hypothetical protein
MQEKLEKQDVVTAVKAIRANHPQIDSGFFSRSKYLLDSLVKSSTPGLK